MPDPHSSPIEIWTFRQRKALLGMAAVLLVILLLLWRLNPVTVPDPLPDTMPRATEIQDRIDPNTASVAALSAIPNLGESRARSIVEYREEFARKYPGATPFKLPQDLMRIKGIGTAIVSSVEPFLIFPASR